MFFRLAAKLWRIASTGATPRSATSGGANHSAIVTSISRARPTSTASRLTPMPAITPAPLPIMPPAVMLMAPPRPSTPITSTITTIMPRNSAPTTISGVSLSPLKAANRSPTSSVPPPSSLRAASIQLPTNTGSSSADASWPTSGMNASTIRMMNRIKPSTIQIAAFLVNSAQASVHHLTPWPPSTARGWFASLLVVTAPSMAGPPRRYSGCLPRRALCAALPATARALQNGCRGCRNRWRRAVV